MHVLITAATAGEWMPAFLKNNLRTKDTEHCRISFHTSGIGILASTYSITKLVIEEKPDLVFQVGLAGCFDTTIPLTEVVLIKNDFVGDMGVEEEGEWKDLFDMKLENPDRAPYDEMMLPNHHLEKFDFFKLKSITGVTVNEITTKEKRIQQLTKKYKPVIESMEGAALHYVCRNLNVSFLQMRAISNYVGERNKSKWMIKEAINNLNKTLLRYIDEFYKLE